MHHDVSLPLRDVPAASEAGSDKKKEKPLHGVPVPAPGGPDPVVQASTGSAAAPTPGVGFEGIGQGFVGPAGTFTVNSAPPDPNATVGPLHIVEIVNQSFAIFNKSGVALYGPVATNTLWSGFGGGCQTNNDGDATVKYDQAADRWIFSQFSVSTTPYLQCVAVSQNGDPTGAYYRYSFQYGNFPDYPKLGVWPDGYYTTFNMFRGGTTFVGPEVCAYDRAKMLAGLPATQQCSVLSTTYGSLLPSDLDGSTPPPAGSPNYLVSFGTNSLQLWKFHVDWTTPANSTLTGPTTIAVASFSPACAGGGGTCIPQGGTTQKLDSLGDRLMYRLAYRNFGDHESLVVNHSVTAGTSVGVRWYELRAPNSTPSVYQQGTYAPDSSYRWMGAAAMDKNGGIGLGFSVSSASIHPGIHYTGRLAADPLGQITQGEGALIDGAGSQTGNLSRWGDYSSMAIDPSDDCTFWYTGEYEAASGSFNWHTRIGSFKLPGCGAAAANDFSISAAPGSLSLAQGTSGTSTISTAVTSGAAETVALTVGGVPAGSTATLTPTAVSAGGSSTLTVNAGTAAAGTYTLTVTGTAASATHTTTVSLTVVGLPAPDFTLAATPAPGFNGSVVHGNSTSYAVTITPQNGFNGVVSLSVSGLPNRTTASFSPNPATSTSTLTVTTARKTRTGTFTLTITGSGSGITRTTTVTLVVT